MPANLHYVGAILTLTPVAPVLFIQFVYRHIIGTFPALDPHCHGAVQDVLERYMDDGLNVEERCTDTLRYWCTHLKDDSEGS